MITAPAPGPWGRLVTALAREDGMCWVARWRFCIYPFQGNLWTFPLFSGWENSWYLRAGKVSSYCPPLCLMSWVPLFTSSSHNHCLLLPEEFMRALLPFPCYFIPKLYFNNHTKRSKTFCLKTGFGSTTCLKTCFLHPIYKMYSIF